MAEYPLVERDTAFICEVGPDVAEAMQEVAYENEVPILVVKLPQVAVDAIRKITLRDCTQIAEETSSLRPANWNYSHYHSNPFSTER